MFLTTFAMIPPLPPMMVILLNRQAAAGAHEEAVDDNDGNDDDDEEAVEDDKYRKKYPKILPPNMELRREHHGKALAHQLLFQSRHLSSDPQNQFCNSYRLVDLSSLLCSTEN